MRTTQRILGEILVNNRLKSLLAYRGLQNLRAWGWGGAGTHTGAAGGHTEGCELQFGKYGCPSFKKRNENGLQWHWLDWNSQFNPDWTCYCKIIQIPTSMQTGQFCLETSGTHLEKKKKKVYNMPPEPFPILFGKLCSKKCLIKINK